MELKGIKLIREYFIPKINIVVHYIKSLVRNLSIKSFNCPTLIFL